MTRSAWRVRTQDSGTATIVDADKFIHRDEWVTFYRSSEPVAVFAVSRVISILKEN